MNTAEAARRLGVSPRRVRALIATGRVAARKVSGRWDVTDLGSGARRRRPLSARSRRLLARALHTRSLRGLTGQERARTAARVRELRASPDAARLLVEWWGAAAPGSTGLAANLVEHALAGNWDYVTETLRRRPHEYLRRRENLADVVATERTIRGLTRRQLAESAGVRPEEVRSVERAEPVRSPATIRRILRAVDVEPTALPDLVDA